MYFERERDRAREQGRDREGMPSRFCAVSTEVSAEPSTEPDTGLELMNCKIMT